ncbi:hypothetical protein [Solicola gregarius]|uniref:Uncharacterized protein n=1 Tax=Solicola gregarius TaxID=2908642 RepID=A0AA46YIS2_9ACTN|nr:hypothetical protein [Solicola gregarius]UYM03450.1 hypothetical protein L0C25_12875 [Solicola gregarius]
MDDESLDVEGLLDRLAESVEERRQQRADLAAGLDHLARSINLSARSEWTAGEASPLSADRASPSLGSDAAALVGAEARLLMASAVDHARALSRSVAEADTYLGGITLARGVFESAIRAHYILAGTTTDDRVQRALTQRYARLVATDKVDQLLGGTSPSEDDFDEEVDEDDLAHRVLRTVDEIESYAASRQWKVWRKRPCAVGKRVTFTDIVDDLPEGDNALGRYLWSSKSALAHGEILESARQWMDLMGDPFDRDNGVPVWLLAQAIGGGIVGPWVLAATLERYTGTEHDLRPDTVRLLDVWSRTADLHQSR